MYRIIFLVVSLLIIFSSGGPVRAAEVAGEIVRLEGRVLLYANNAVRGRQTVPGTVFAVGDFIKTKRNSTAFVRLIDGSRAVLKSDSILKINGISRSEVEEGTVLFEIRKQGRARGMTITSKTVTMGVKGTRFGVVAGGRDVAIFLKEGVLEIAALAGKFKRHYSTIKGEHEQLKQAMEDDFRVTIEEMRSRFNQAREGLRKGNFELVKKFDMEGGHAVMIRGNEVRDQSIPADMEESFKLLDTF